MKCSRLFLLLLMIPTLIYGFDYDSAGKKAIKKWNSSEELIKKSTTLGPHQSEECIRILNEAIGFCRNAITYADKILKHLANESKKDRESPDGIKTRNIWETNKATFSTQIQTLEKNIQAIYSNIAHEKANLIYEECEKRAGLARTKYHQAFRLLSDANTAIASLNEAAHLIEQSAADIRHILTLLSQFANEGEKTFLNQRLKEYQETANKYKKEAAEWPATLLAQKSFLKEQYHLLKEERRLLDERGHKRSSLEVQKQMVPILKELVACGETDSFSRDLAELTTSIATLEKVAPSSHPVVGPLPEELATQEKLKREIFFKSDLRLNPDIFIQGILQNGPRPLAIPLDGQFNKKKKDFTLYTGQFYRFLVQSDTPASHIYVKVYEHGKVLHLEKILLPLKKTLAWERYLIKEGMLFVPETKLKTEFGLDLYLTLVPDPTCDFSLVISQKGTQSRYQFSVSLDEEHSLYGYHFTQPPPWQLGMLSKPALTSHCKPINKLSVDIVPLITEEIGSPSLLESSQSPILDKFVEELNKDPLLIAQYVYNEIAFVDPFKNKVDKFFYPIKIQRNACTTFLEKQGSPWEQCQLLVDLLRKAGYPAVYAAEAACSLTKTFVEKMFLTQIPGEQEEAYLKYPWVLFFDGKKWISLFPWMKEMQVREGYELYSLLPEEYASADRWILRYLKNDEKILKHIGPNGDDSAGVLFVRFLEEELKNNGLSLDDVGIHRVQVKRQMTSWEDFPRPVVMEDPQFIVNLSTQPELFACVTLEISSTGNPQNKLPKYTVPLVNLNCSPCQLFFSPTDFHLDINGINTIPLQLFPTDQSIDIKVDHIGLTQTFSITRNTSAALCFQSGGASQKMTSFFQEEFEKEKGDNRLQALLAFIGAAYFEKCGRAEQILADLHKIVPDTVLGFGLAKLAPEASIKGVSDTTLPQVDMFWIRAGISSDSTGSVWHQEIRNAVRQCKSLTTVDFSSNEHQILKDIFNDSNAISTVKLLQLAHLEHQKTGNPDTGFLVFTKKSFEAAESFPEVAKTLYFSHQDALNLRQVKTASPQQWNTTQYLLDPKTTFSDWTYAYMTPGPVSNLNGTYQEMGTLILHPYTQHSLISSNNLTAHGGSGSPIPNSYFIASAIKQFEILRNHDSFRLQPEPKPSSIPIPFLGTTKLKGDVRPESKSVVNIIGDPVDVVTGAFYVDEVDLSLPGPFPLQIRRNYNSQNPVIGDFGCGWKLSLNPFLIEQDGKLYAAEEDGTVIVYSFNPATSRWEVSSEDNPDLSNYNSGGVGSTANPFHAYIENNILYGTDGSKRFFEEGLLKKWINARGNTLTFIYDEKRLLRIESSHGNFLGFHYNHEGKISEIYAKDGRRVIYTYDSQGDLRSVKLPNDAVIKYEYDTYHRITTETKPHGRVLFNEYVEGRVEKQSSPMGFQQKMIVTATFAYEEGQTTVTDANGGKTVYKIFQKQIYKITDPLGYQILQSWFIDDKSYFDPETERVVEWNQPGGWQRSLKSSTDKRGLTTYYLYDNRGNPIEIRLLGEDLTGSGEKLIAKKLAYNDQNLCVEEEASDQKTLIIYDPVLTYLPKKIEKYSGNILLSYTEMEYTLQGQLQKENHSGAITLWEYDNLGFPLIKKQITGTDDPDVIMAYSYNKQGQCIKVIAPDGIQESDYDIMGNMLMTQVTSPSGTLLSATYLDYNQNNEPIWKQTANDQNVLYLDYHASGRVKASRQVLSQTNQIAYRLYEYDSCGYLIEEVDPLGFCTYREYDLLGRVQRETKENLSTFFTYEAGGLIESMTSPSGAKTIRHYTTNGLVKEEIYPDGTKSSIIYDFFGRPLQETKKGITWQVRYDDANHRVIRTHPESQTTEIQEFDERGNLICLIDPAGHAWKKTYDGLGRLKTETTPTGKQTIWSYVDDHVICRRPNGEKIVNRYEGGRVAESETFDASGQLIAKFSYQYDPKSDIQTVIQGDEITTTWMNALGLPVAVQKGEVITAYEYDACGNCMTATDGEGRTTRQTFDGLGRIIHKELPDGSSLFYSYDPDSNLSECKFPNNTSWSATYDEMGRKSFEELQAKTGPSQQWSYIYEAGYLTKTIDPMQRSHEYHYDSQGRMAQEAVDGWQRIFKYDPRGSLASAEQKREGSSGWFFTFNNEHSSVERTYDPDGHLASESIYLNSTLLQETEQTWSPGGRSLHVEGHQRQFIYQNNRLVQIATPHINLAYTYDLSGSLKTKVSPVSTMTMEYNAAGLPEKIYTQLPEGVHEQSLRWDQSGKLSFYAAPKMQKQFTYTPKGHLKSAGDEKYEFDFGAMGIGIRTSAPNRYVPQDGLDGSGKIISEITAQNLIETAYNPMGEMILHDQRQFEWDPWGRLLKVSDGSLTWEASYDALGRRLQTRYTAGWSSTLTTTSIYDPEEEFGEIGVKYGSKTFWKVYGPNSCDAVSDETGASVYLMQNALGHLAGVIGESGSHFSEQVSVYGPQTAGSILSDLLTYAQSISWHSKSQDPTGLIWMGARYYDPKGGRFISPDPVSYPVSMDLYAYAGGDPVNYNDPDGRFHSPVYKGLGSSILTLSINSHGEDRRASFNNPFKDTSKKQEQYERVILHINDLPGIGGGQGSGGHAFLEFSDRNLFIGNYPEGIRNDDYKKINKNTTSIEYFCKTHKIEQSLDVMRQIKWTSKHNCVYTVIEGMKTMEFIHADKIKLSRVLPLPSDLRSQMLRFHGYNPNIITYPRQRIEIKHPRPTLFMEPIEN